MTSSSRPLLVASGLTFLTLASAPLAMSQLANPPVFTDIFDFAGTGGTGPNGKFLITANGTLYGTTYNGGDASNLGTVFSLMPAMGGTYTETVLYTFTGGSNSAHPTAGLLRDASGSLYGTAAGVGKSSGAVFKLTPPVSGSTWTYEVIHAFGSGADGAGPNCDLLFLNGSVYGTTVFGGAYGQGTAFSLTQSGGVWTEAVIHNFTAGGDGSKPYSGLVADTSGALYGTAGAGGNGLYGTVYKLTRPTGGGILWPLQTLYAFSGPDGKFPLAGVYLDSSGNIFGTTYVGCGLGHGGVYKLTPGSTPGSYTESVIYAFSGPDGSNPSDVLTPDGASGFYTTTGAARTATGGNVVHLTPPTSPGGPWTATTLYAFSGGADGQAPLASVALNPAGTALFGTAFYGGAYGGGVAFRLQ